MMMMTAPVIFLLSSIGSIQGVQNTTQYDRGHDNLPSNGSHVAVSSRPDLLVSREISHNSTTTGQTYTEIFTTLTSNIISSTGNKQSTGFSDHLIILLYVMGCITLLPFGWILVLQYRKNRNAKKLTRRKSRSRSSRRERMESDYEKYPFDRQHDLKVTSTNLSEHPHNRPDLICGDQTDDDYEEPSKILSDPVYQTLDLSSQSDSIYHHLKPKSNKTQEV
ncbi:uncharacterized protein [Misgurnus anguillicaudatus]|uniref:uncharacterized protein isoform X2 n=1 Tax=Misgurnus anguillicaudatus TaxID=75329 RepID=UPI003CCF90D1